MEMVVWTGRRADEGRSVDEEVVDLICALTMFCVMQNICL